MVPASVTWNGRSRALAGASKGYGKRSTANHGLRYIAGRQGPILAKKRQKMRTHLASREV